MERHKRHIGVSAYTLGFIRVGKSKVSSQPPLTLGADLSGIVEKLEFGVIGFNRGVEVYDVTNPAALWRECRVCHGLGRHDRSQTKTIAPIWIGAVLNKERQSDTAYQPRFE